MKRLICIACLVAAISACNSTSKPVADSTPQTVSSDTVKIANEELEYEIIITDPGFNSFLYGQAMPRGYYSESYLEGRNEILVREWNNRVRQPLRFNPDLFLMEIDYDPSIHYGYEVNYLLYNYFLYFQLRNKIQLSGFVPRP